jgi:hypothetical protein
VLASCNSTVPVENSQVDEARLVVSPGFGYRVVFEETGVIDYEFSLQNMGARPMRLLDVRPSCSCTVAKLSSSVIQPGDQVTLNVVYDVQSQFGELANRDIFIRTDSSQSPETSFKIGGFRYKRYEVTPVSVDFGKTEIGRAASTEVTIEAIGEDNELEFDRAIATSPFIAAELLEAGTTRLGRRYRARIALTSEAPIGDFEQKLFVPRKQNDGVGPQLWVRAKICGPLQADPSVAYFGILAKGDAPSKVSIKLKPLNSEDRHQFDSKISDVVFQNTPMGFTACVAMGEPDTIEVIADPAKLPFGPHDLAAIISCKYSGRRCRIDLGLRILIID